MDNFQGEYNQTKENIEKNSEFLNKKKISRRRRRKFLFIILIIVFLNIVFFFAVARYEQYLGEKRVDELAKALEDWRQDKYARALADTYGGDTPQETLQMYIDAVEKGDYELASKYFIESKREKELKSFEGASQENLQKYITFLKQAVNNYGSYSADKTGFVIRKPILIDFKQYPNGIWKIIEI